MSFDILCVGWNKNEESEWYVVPRKIVNLNNIYTGRMIMMEYYHEKIVEIDLKSLKALNLILNLFILLRNCSMGEIYL